MPSNIYGTQWFRKAVCFKDDDLHLYSAAWDQPLCLCDLKHLNQPAAQGPTKEYKQFSVTSRVTNTGTVVMQNSVPR
jgi:hypothetical protein